MYAVNFRSAMRKFLAAYAVLVVLSVPLVLVGDAPAHWALWRTPFALAVLIAAVMCALGVLLALVAIATR